MSDQLHVAADCPYCPGASKVFILARRDTGALVYYCPHCGCAWPGAACFDENVAPDDLDALAPAGVRLPAPGELPVATAPAARADSAAWRPHIDPLVAL